MAADPLRFGPLNPRTIHLCVDMQNLYAEDTPWRTPWMQRVLPVIARIVERVPGQTVFTRFIPAATPEEMPGTWRRYYEKWRDLNLERLDPRLLDLVPPLGRFVPPAAVVDKKVYSAFAEPTLPALLRQRHADSIVVTGSETDVC